MNEEQCIRYKTEGKCTNDKYTRCEYYNNGNCLSSYELEKDLRIQPQTAKEENERLTKNKVDILDKRINLKNILSVEQLTQQNKQMREVIDNIQAELNYIRFNACDSSKFWIEERVGLILDIVLQAKQALGDK